MLRIVFFQVYQLVDVFTVRGFATPESAPSSWLEESIIVELTGLAWLPFVLIAIKVRLATTP